MGKQSGTQTQSKAPWGPAQGSLMFGLNELNRIYGNQTGRMAPATNAMNVFGFTPNPAAAAISGYQDPRSFFGMGGGTVRQQPQQPQQPQQFQQAPAQTNPFSVQEFGLLDPAAQELKATISGERLNGQNPYLEDVIARSMNDVNSIFEGKGRYGSGAQLDTLFTKAAAPIRYANYATERQNQLNAVQAAPGFEMAPYQLYSARQAAPYEGLRNYLGLANAVAGQGGESSQPIYKNPLSGALGGAALGAGLGSLMAPAGATGLAAVGGWPFLLGGALLGGLGGM